MLLWKASCGDGFGCKNQYKPEPVSFASDSSGTLEGRLVVWVLAMAPLMVKEACLSLRAFDPVLDLKTLVHEEFGRRVNLLEPERSLLLAKPQGGGARRRTTFTQRRSRAPITQGLDSRRVCG